MPISETDIKKLWGLSAGRCSKPGCEQECVQFLKPGDSDPIIIGEMAHVISPQPGGPRGPGGDDTYENRILLCPTHHTEVDKAADTYPADVLHKWKNDHEERVRKAFAAVRYSSRKELGTAIKRLLLENKHIWQQYGPESQEATLNPISSMHRIWNLRKLATVVPNNSKITGIIETNKDNFDINDYPVCVAFIEHAKGFELNCYTRTEGIPRFPAAFEELINRYAEFQ